MVEVGAGEEEEEEADDGEVEEAGREQGLLCFRSSLLDVRNHRAFLDSAAGTTW